MMPMATDIPESSGRFDSASHEFAVPSLVRDGVPWMHDSWKGPGVAKMREHRLQPHTAPESFRLGL